MILVSIGTDGDIFPYVGLGKRWRALGHNVTLIASARYTALASSQHFGFRELVSADEESELFDHPDFWHPLKSAALSPLGCALYQTAIRAFV